MGLFGRRVGSWLFFFQAGARERRTSGQPCKRRGLSLSPSPLHVVSWCVGDKVAAIALVDHCRRHLDLSLHHSCHVIT